MSNFYCAAPWRGLHINPRGDVKTCCAGNPNMLGNLNTQTIEEILHGPVLQEIRQTLQQGKPHEKYCYNCVQSERYGRSERDWHNGLNPDFDIKSATLTDYIPTLIDIRWNTTCNLSCNYCTEMCSSKWASLKGIAVNNSTRHYYTDVCNFIEKHHDYIQEVALIGGEPLLLKENIKLLDVIPSNCVVTVITNLSMPLENNEIFKKLAKRKRVGWSISFDNTGAQFEYVRHGSSWNILQENLAIIKSLIVTDVMEFQSHWGGIHAVYNMYNATKVTELRQFAHSQGLSVLWQNLFGPEYLDPTKHSQAIAQLAADEIEKFYATGLATNIEFDFFNNLLKKYQSITDTITPQTQEFVDHIRNIENKYHPDQQGKFATLWPELANIFNRQI